MFTSGRSRTALLAVLAMVGSLLLLVAPAGGAEAASGTGRVRGAVYGGGISKVTMLWFTKDWTYLGRRTVHDGIYTLRLKPGTYRIQFVDQRPAYDVTKAAPKDIKVTIGAGGTKTRNVHMRRGAAVTGTVKAGGKVARGAKVVAANTSEQSFEVKANSKGQFALGGLPAGSYSVFTYDRKKRYVAKSLWVPRMKSGQAKNVSIHLNRKAGRLLVDVYAGPNPATGTPTVTVVSRSNGQFWSAKVRHGSASFSGLYPGKYKIVVPGVGNYLPATGKVRGGTVKGGRVAFGSYRLTKRGATVSGTVVDAKDPSYPLSGAQVLLFDKAGAKLGTATTNSRGVFSFGGQLTTQNGMTVVAQPGQYSAYLGKGTHYCKYGKKKSPTFVVHTGRNTTIGKVALPHLAASQQDSAEVCGP
ncbi:MSCRAMM family protein [Nocardioides sp. URHA0020]|uniref:MSCRAMM family protein n=1 Tax=Nocardioides sp. URHA0020 TaxID=1380392 RepID=UPI0004902E07|nr:hypothetical protein [Nocardioides sp. URHA0020]